MFDAEALHEGQRQFVGCMDALVQRRRKDVDILAEHGSVRVYANVIVLVKVVVMCSVNVG